MSGVTPGSPEWERRITASKVAAILGLSPWESPRSVWHRMHGDLPTEEQTEVQGRGHFLEPAILAWWKSQHPEYPILNEQETYLLGSWAAATPDAEASTGTQDDGTCDFALVEAKSTAYDDEWGQSGTDQIPAYYLTQVIWQMHVSGIHRCYVPMIGPRLRFAEYVVDYEPYVEDAALIERKMREFYDTLAANEPPPLDDSVATFEAVKKVHPDINGESIEVSAEMARDLIQWQHQSKSAEAPLRLAKSRVVEAMGKARYATHAGVKVARRQSDGPDRTKFVVVGKPDDLPEEIA